MELRREVSPVLSVAVVDCPAHAPACAANRIGRALISVWGAGEQCDELVEGARFRVCGLEPAKNPRPNEARVQLRSSNRTTWTALSSKDKPLAATTAAAATAASLAQGTPSRTTFTHRQLLEAVYHPRVVQSLGSLLKFRDGMLCASHYTAYALTHTYARKPRLHALLFG